MSGKRDARVDGATASPSFETTMATSLEERHVTRVYNHIAKHFSDTRHTPWPKVRSFLLSLDAGSLVYDVGCGNGKYFLVNPSIQMMGVDSSIELLLISRQKGMPVVLADAKRLPFRSQSADNVISIAVLHHLSSPDTRSQAVREISRVLKSGGSALLTVWAFEQNRNGSGSKYITGTKSTLTTDSVAPSSTPALASQRHEPEKSFDCTSASSHRDPDSLLPSSKDSSGEMSPHEGLPIHKSRTAFERQDVLVPWTCRQTGERLLRYYHVFVEGELESLCQGIPGIRVIDHFYDDGNWCVVMQKHEGDCDADHHPLDEHLPVAVS